MTVRTRSRAFVLNVISSDHPGIVAQVTHEIRGMGGNIEACSQTVLGGFFTLIMIVRFQKDITQEALVGHLRGPESEHRGFQVTVLPARAGAPVRDTRDVETFVVTATGKDKPGVIMRFSQYLSDKDINIVDLYGDKKGDEFVLITQVEVPTHWSVDMIQADLEEMGREEGFDVRFQHENVFVATNQLRLPHHSEA